MFHLWLKSIFFNRWRITLRNSSLYLPINASHINSISFSICIWYNFITACTWYILQCIRRSICLKLRSIYRFRRRTCRSNRSISYLFSRICSCKCVLLPRRSYKLKHIRLSLYLNKIPTRIWRQCRSRLSAYRT